MSAGDNQKLNLTFEFPYLAHAPMEPLDVVVEHKRGKVTTWFGCQLPTVDQGMIAQVFGVKAEQVKINTLLAGGSFGRRATPDSGVAVEAAHAAKAYAKPVPVKLVWTREDDIQGGRYRPMSVHNVAMAISPEGANFRLETGCGYSVNRRQWAHLLA